MMKIFTLTIAMILVGTLPTLANVQPDRSIGEKSFHLNMGVWVDLEYDALRMSERVQKIKFLSEDYFLLMERYPEILPYLGLGKRLILVLNDEIIAITPDM
ncbi:MAG: hypothetical protein QF645_12520 [Planctomycetota bacterium]|nr:hypothetical protein [Planctomycetota bacterium]